MTSTKKEFMDARVSARLGEEVPVGLYVVARPLCGVDELDCPWTRLLSRPG